MGFEIYLLITVIALSLIKIPLTLFLIWHNIQHKKTMIQVMDKIDSHIKWIVGDLNNERK